MKSTIRAVNTSVLKIVLSHLDKGEDHLAQSRYGLTPDQIAWIRDLPPHQLLDKAGNSALSLFTLRRAFQVTACRGASVNAPTLYDTTLQTPYAHQLVVMTFITALRELSAKNHRLASIRLGVTEEFAACSVRLSVDAWFALAGSRTATFCPTDVLNTVIRPRTDSVTTLRNILRSVSAPAA